MRIEVKNINVQNKEVVFLYNNVEYHYNVATDLFYKKQGGKLVVTAINNPMLVKILKQQFVSFRQYNNKIDKEWYFEKVLYLCGGNG